MLTPCMSAPGELGMHANAVGRETTLPPDPLLLPAHRRSSDPRGMWCAGVGEGVAAAEAAAW